MTEKVSTKKSQLKRTKKRRREGSSHDDPTFFQLYGLDVLGALALVGAIFVLINPFKNWARPLEYGEFASFGRNFTNWLGLEGGFLLIGFVLLFIAFSIIALRVRHRVKNNRAYWNIACPTCENTALKRTQRTDQLRWLGKISRLPIRRYVCTNCQWKGARLDYTRIKD